MKREATDRNLYWPAVLEAYDQIRIEEKSRREYPDEVRRAAWTIATTPGCHPFWRFGFQKRWGKQVAELDHTIVPNYDTIAQEVAWYFPEYQGDDGTARLFDFLFSPRSPMPSAEEMYRKAMDRVELELITSRDSESIAAFPDEEF
jgi:hypothetical protein